MPQNFGLGPAKPAGLPLEWVFVLKLADDPGPGRWVGQLEHMVSGREHDFSSMQELLAALQQRCQPQPP